MKRGWQYPICGVILFIAAQYSSAESMRCRGDIVDVGDTKADVMTKCGSPAMTDSFCEKTQHKIEDSRGKITFVESCDNVDVWTYNPGPGQFWTHLYFAEGKLREMKYGERIQ